MNQIEIKPPFRLSTGGLFYRLLLRLRLVEKDRYHPWRRIAVFSGLTWLPLLILATCEGTLFHTDVSITFLHDPVPHFRYLLALPLLVIADWFIDPYMAGIVRHFQISGLVPKDAMSNYEKSVEKLLRQRDAGWVDVVLAGVAYVLVWMLIFQSDLSSVESGSSSWMMTHAQSAIVLTLAGWWLSLVSSPFLLFILLRWLWRLIIWIGFMNRVSGLPLAIQPAHPDQVGGLGLLTSAQFSFGVILAAVGAMMSSSLAKEIIHAGRPLSDVPFEILGFVLICYAVIIGPLCTFTNQLINAKRRELRHYSALGFQLSNKFHSKWIKDIPVKQSGEIITAVDPSAMADYSAVYETISTMKLIPLTRQKLLWLVLFVLAPFVPLVFTQISIREALQRLAQTIV